MFGRFRGRNRQTAAASQDEDEAIVHLTVPDEVLYSDPKEAEPKDMSWLDSLPLTDDEPAAPVVPNPVAAAAARSEPDPVPEPAPQPQSEAANVATDGRPRFPYGWLVVVEGAQTGDWFPLERGTSTIGSDAGCTIRLETRFRGQIALRFDETRHGFVLESDTTLRVNGVERGGPEYLRDGDTFTLGGESLRLVALCSQNFHWAKDIAAE